MSKLAYYRITGSNKIFLIKKNATNNVKTVYKLINYIPKLIKLL